MPLPRETLLGTGDGQLATETPFDDAAFVSRLQKLLSMLGSAQPAEAEAARRKLLEHLANHRLSLTDVAERLRDAGRPAQGGGGGFGLGLERQLQIARVARQEAEFDVLRARQRVTELSRALQEASVDAGRALAGRARARVLAGAGWLLAGAACMILLGQTLHRTALLSDQAAMRAGQALLRPTDPETGDDALQASQGARLGTVLTQDLPVRLTPSPDGEIRAFLNRGTRVVLQRQVRIGLYNWLLIRSVTGAGWVPSADVLY